MNIHETRAHSITDVCSTLGIARSTFYRLAAAGRLPARKVAGRTVVLSRDLEAFIDSLPPAYADVQGGE